jgi:hypothetical protein
MQLVRCGRQAFNQVGNLRRDKFNRNSSASSSANVMRSFRRDDQRRRTHCSGCMFERVRRITEWQQRECRGQAGYYDRAESQQDHARQRNDAGVECDCC